MIQLQLREFFEAHADLLTADPHGPSPHHEDLMRDHARDLLRPSVVAAIRSGLNQKGYVLISTDAGDFAPPTPTSLLERYPGPYYGEAVLALVGQTVGTLQRLAHQNDGRAYHDIVPIRAYKDRQTSGSSSVTLEMHTELAFVDAPPEYLMLFCVRPDRGRVAETHLYDSRVALADLSPEQLKSLARETHRFALDANIVAGIDPDQRPFAVLDPATAQLLRFDVDLYRPNDAEEAEAFDALRRALLDVRISLRLGQGELLMIDNKRMVHSRSPFEAEHDGRDRWLKRALVRGR